MCWNGGVKKTGEGKREGDRERKILTAEEIHALRAGAAGLAVVAARADTAACSGPVTLLLQ